MVRTLAILCLCAILDQPGNWPHVLRDLLVHNAEGLRQGTTTMRIEHTTGREGRHMEMEAEVHWYDEQYFTRFRVHDSAGELLGRLETKEPLEAQPWDLLLKNREETLGYNGLSHVMLRRPPADNFPTEPLLHFSPRDLWLKCYPPNGSSGRPWTEMVGLSVTGGSGASSTTEYARIDADRVKQVRRDPDGGVLEMVFSLRDSGNVVSFAYTSRDSGAGDSKGSYRWKMLNGVSVLDHCEISEHLPERVRKLTGRTGESRYKLDVIKVSLDPVPMSVFAKSSFLQKVADDTQVIDGISNQNYRARPRSVPSGDVFEGLSKQLRTKGFLNK
jgi:hypothetical protein